MSEQKEYSNGEITIVWKADLCIHSTNCWRGANGLIDVFNPKERPWIKPGAAATQRIIAQIGKCPSGALSFYRNEPELQPEESTSSMQIVEVLENGPLLVYGHITVKDSHGSETSGNNVTAFCRCGQSANKPYCDGSHVTAGFVG
jgi:uncharacterized Fe-S cluster protein YjdI